MLSSIKKSLIFLLLRPLAFTRKKQKTCEPDKLIKLEQNVGKDKTEF